MTWPAWSIDEPAALARYVLPELAEGIRLDIVRDDAIRRGARRDVARAIYDAMLQRNFHYSRESWSPYDGPQKIRDPDDMFSGGNATCLDLALLCAGVCLGHELLPLVVVVEGHAFVAVSLLDDPREPASRARVGRDGAWLDRDGVLDDGEIFARLIAKDGGHYLPIECTGFAKTEASTDDVPGGALRIGGKLDFESAITAARVECAKRGFVCAVDPSLRQRVKGVTTFVRDPAPEQLAQQLRSIFPQIETEKQEAHEREFEKSYLRQVAIKYGRVESPGVPDLKEFRQPLTLSYVSLFVKQSQAEREAGRRLAEYVLETEPLLTVRASAGAGKTTLLNWISLACAQGANPEANDRWRGGVPFFIPLRALKEEGAPDLGRFVDYTVDLKQWPTDIPRGWIAKVLQMKRGVIMLDGVDELPPKVRPDFWRWLKDELMRRYPGNRIIITSRHLPESRGNANWQPPPGFVSADLDEMTDEDVNQFVDRWHEGALATETDSTTRADLVRACEALPAKLADPVNHRVRELCGTPLLCSMICALHWREEGYLPRRRIELYERCVVMLVEERDLKRGIEKPEGPLRWITKGDKEMLLQRMAYQMMKNVIAGEESQARIEISKDQAVRWISGWVSSFEDVKAREADPSEVLVHLVERTTLLRSPVSDTIEFSHRSFQEYLAACAAGAADDAVDLARRADDDQWHEIIILASGTKSGGIPFGNRLISALLKEGERWKLSFMARTSGSRYTYFALAVGSLETAIQPDPELSTRVLGHLKDIVPPRNPSAAKNLSAAGDAALPHLDYDTWKDQSEEIVASCARAVRLIAGGSATKMLITGYGTDKRESVLAEVARGQGVSVFDIPAVRAHLQETGRIQSGLRGFVKDLRGLATWNNASRLPDGGEVGPHLENLDLSGFTSITDLTPLAMLESPRTLNLSDCRNVRDIGPLASLTKLQELRLRGCSALNDLVPLAELQGLELLDLSFCGAVRELGSLVALKKLKELILSGLLSDDIALPPFSSLLALGLRRCSKLTKLAPVVDHLPTLRSLDLAGCTGITDLTPLAALGTSLVHLDLSACAGVNDLSPLRHLKQLEALRVSRMLEDYPTLSSGWALSVGLGVAEIAIALGGFPGSSIAQGVARVAGSLAKSTLSVKLGRQDDQRPGTPSIDFAPIEHLIGLHSLDLSDWHDVKALPSFRALECLETLSLYRWRELSDLTPLAPLKSLHTLNLAGCQRVSNLDPLKALTGLRTISLVGLDKIEDFSPLMGLELTSIAVGQSLFSRLPSGLKSKAEIIGGGHYDEYVLWAARVLGSVPKATLRQFALV